MMVLLVYSTKNELLIRRNAMAYGFGAMIDQLKKNPKKIVFTEGTDERILEASSRLLASNFLQPILVGNQESSIRRATRDSTKWLNYSVSFARKKA